MEGFFSVNFEISKVGINFVAESLKFVHERLGIVNYFVHCIVNKYIYIFIFNTY